MAHIWGLESQFYVKFTPLRGLRAWVKERDNTVFNFQQQHLTFVILCSKKKCTGSLKSLNKAAWT